MKKLMLAIFMLLVSFTMVSADGILPADLKFYPQGGGKFIYSNNEEAIWKRALSYTSNPTPSYIMNNDDLGKGKYSVFVSHVNHTETIGDENVLTSLGFDIEVDVQIIANEDTVISLNAIGFDVMSAQVYKSPSGLYKEQSTWDLIQAWADYIQLPIYTVNIHRNYYPTKFEPVIIELKEGEQAWLSQYIANYKTIPYLKFMNIIADLEVVRGGIDLNVAALRHNGRLRDRSHHSPYAARAIYYRDKQYKGIAETLPKVNAELSYTIDDSVEDGSLLPVKVFNQYNKNGNTVQKWFTHINPQEDRWSKNTSAESDMLLLEYYDEEKLKYYSDSIPQKLRNSVWKFDVFHSDTKESPGGIPNYKLDVGVDNIGNGANLGNYAVVTSYKITITNDGSKKRYLNYSINANSGNVVFVRDSEGKLVYDYGIRKNGIGRKSEDVLACLELPANSTVTYYIEEVFPANYPGGMENSLTITDLPKQPNIDVTGESYSIIKEQYKNTGKEFYKFDDKKLYFSQYGVIWNEQSLSHDASSIFEGFWSNYEILYLDGVYTARWFEYDAGPFYDEPAKKLCSKIHFFDQQFNLIKTHYYDDYPEKVFYENGKIITMAGNKKVAVYSDSLLPVITVSLNGKQIIFDVDPIIESERTLVPIRALFEKMGADVSWNEDTRTATIIKGDDLIEFSIDNNTALINGNEKVMDVPARQINWRTLVPLRFLSENLGYTVNWDDSTRAVSITATDE